MPGAQYEKLRAALQVNFSTCEAAASRSDTLANHSIRCSDRRFSVPGEANYVDGGWSSAHERLTQSTLPSYDMPNHRERSQGTVEINTMTQNTGDDGLNQAHVGCADSSSMAQPSVTQEDAWYSLSFAEAGIEQFAGYEPLFLFQQGWSTFS